MAQEKVVIVGAGSIAAAWLPRLKEENVTVACIVELNLQRAQQRIIEYGLDGAEASENLKEAIERHHPHFVLDLSVPEAHGGVTCTALSAGCHVLGEKPMAASMAEARRMIKTAEQTGRLYMVSQSRRWNAKHDMMRRTVQAGKLGPVTTVNCDLYRAIRIDGFRREMASPMLTDIAIHYFDLARYLTGADPVSVYAREFNPPGSWFKGDASAMCVFEMTGGVEFNFRGSCCSQGMQTSWNGHWRLIGERGSILYENDQEPQGQIPASASGPPWQYDAMQLEPSPLKHEVMHGALREMLEYLRTGKKPQTPCHDNIKSLAMVFAAIESSRTGRTVPVQW